MPKQIGNERRKKEKDYMERFNHKEVVITLINDQKFAGKLHSKGDRFNVLLEVNGRKILIPKHSILYLAEIEEGGENPC